MSAVPIEIAIKHLNNIQGWPEKMNIKQFEKQDSLNQIKTSGPNPEILMLSSRKYAHPAKSEGLTWQIGSLLYQI